MTKLTNDQSKIVSDMIERANKIFEDKVVKDLENRIDRLESINSSKEDEIAELKANLITLKARVDQLEKENKIVEEKREENSWAMIVTGKQNKTKIN
jgi:hypothetical protein